MKVRCLNNCRGNLDLTVGKEYEVIREENLMGEKAYVVMNDCNIPQPYFLKRSLRTHIIIKRVLR